MTSNVKVEEQEQEKQADVAVDTNIFSDHL
jgi:hypothetical protein